MCFYTCLMLIIHKKCKYFNIQNTNVFTLLCIYNYIHKSSIFTDDFEQKFAKVHTCSTLLNTMLAGRSPQLSGLCDRVFPDSDDFVDSPSVSLPPLGCLAECFRWKNPTGGRTGLFKDRNDLFLMSELLSLSCLHLSVSTVNSRS